MDQVSSGSTFHSKIKVFFLMLVFFQRHAVMKFEFNTKDSNKYVLRKG